MLFSFPSRYLFTIDRSAYLALPHSRGRFPQDFTSLVVLKTNRHTCSQRFAYGTITLFGSAFQRIPLRIIHRACLQEQTTQSPYNTFYATAPAFRQQSPMQPKSHTLMKISRLRFGLFPFRSPLLRECSNVFACFPGCPESQAK